MTSSRAAVRGASSTPSWTSRTSTHRRRPPAGSPRRCGTQTVRAALPLLLLAPQRACLCWPLRLACLRAVYSDGKVCISILHNPGEDPHGYENANERWSPIHTVSWCRCLGCCRALPEAASLGISGRSRSPLYGAPSNRPPCTWARCCLLLSPIWTRLRTARPLSPSLPARGVRAGGDHHDLHHLDALLAQRRVPGQHRRCQAVARRPGRLQEEGVQARAQVAGDALTPEAMRALRPAEDGILSRAGSDLRSASRCCMFLPSRSSAGPGLQVVQPA